MKLIGLSGPAGVGKDTIADYLVTEHGFTKFSFSDALYREVSEAFGVSVEELQDRENKEVPHAGLTAEDCTDDAFCEIMQIAACERGEHDLWERVRFSPRWVLQHWGTEYRRAQDPDYWVKAAALWVQAWLDVTRDDGEPHAGLVNTSVRFANEVEFIRSLDGQVWHVRRRDTSTVASGLDHVAEQGLTIARNDITILNYGNIDHLRTAACLAMQSEPGATITAEAPYLVACCKCGWLHMPYTRERAQREVDNFNAAFDQMPPEHQEMYGGRRASIDNYIGCLTCGSTDFRRAADDDFPGDSYGAITINPVIYEETA